MERAKLFPVQAETRKSGSRIGWCLPIGRGRQPNGIKLAIHELRVGWRALTRRPGGTRLSRQREREPKRRLLAANLMPLGVRTLPNRGLQTRAVPSR